MSYDPTRRGAIGWAIFTVIAVIVLAIIGLFSMVF